MRILIAEDDEALAKFVRQGLEAEHYTVDVFPDGEQARNAATEVEYDVVILDLNLPKLDGVGVLRHLRLKKPSLPVLVLTQRTRVEDRVQCLDTGADDYIPKQLSSASLDILHLRQDLVAKIRAAAAARKPGTSGTGTAGARTAGARTAGTGTAGTRVPGIASRKPPRAANPELHGADPNPPAIVAIGSSTGGPRALQEILPVLSPDLSVPVLIVQHMPPGFTGPFAQRLNSLCSVTVREAAHGDILRPGFVYIAPAGTHMTVNRSSDSCAFVCLATHPEKCLHMPSVDIMMKSVADTFRNLAMGVILTGMGSDGAEGMMSIHRQGGLTIGQDETSCIVYGMPRACAELGALTRVVPLSQVPLQIMQATRSRRRA